MIRVGVVGAGYFGRFHYDAWSRMPDVEFAGLCVRNPDAARPLAEEFGVPALHPDIDALIEVARPQLIDITSPPETHFAMIRAAAGRVPYLICQKPFCSTLTEARTAAAIAEAKGTRLAIHENIRFQPWYREIRRQIDAGRLGTAYQLAFRLRPGDGQGEDAYLARQPYFREMPKFLVRETAIHWVDTFRYLMGEVSAVTARLRRLNPAIAGEDAGVILFEFAGGAAGLFDGNRLADHAATNRRLTLGEMELEGAKGSFRLDGDGRVSFRAHGSNEAELVDFEWQDRNFGGDCVYLTNRAILEAFRDGGPLETDARSYLRNLEIEDAIYQSAETGSRVEV